MQKVLNIVLIIISLSFYGYSDEQAVNTEKLQVSNTEKNLTISNKYYKITFNKKLYRFVEVEYISTGKKIKNPYMATNFLQFDRKRIEYFINAKNCTMDFKHEEPVLATLTFTGKFSSTSYSVNYSIEFTFYADKPVIKYNADILQDPAVKWMLIRLNQWNPLSHKKYNDDSNCCQFKSWAVGENHKSGLLSEVKRIIKPLNWKKGYRWICTYSDSADAFGVIAFERDCPFIYVYSDKRIYLNGKYGNWTDKELSLEEFIYIGPAGDKGKEVGVWAKKLFNS